MNKCKKIFAVLVTSAVVIIMDFRFHLMENFTKRFETKKMTTYLPTKKKQYNSTLDFSKFKPRIKSRFDKVERKCKNLEKARLVPNKLPEKLYPRILVNDKHRILFCLIPKVSATTWRRIFIEMSGKRKARNLNKLNNNDIFYKLKTMVKTLKDYDQNGVNFRLQNYTKVIFVRNPLERLLSAYRSKFVNSNEFHKIYGTTIISNLRPNATKKEKKNGSNVTFLEFVKFVTAKRFKHMSYNYHWASYWNLCYPCVVHYDYIGLFQNLPSEANDILSYLGVKNTKFPERNLFYNESKTKSVFNAYYSQIPSNYLNSIHKSYKIDFDLFSFPLLRVSKNYNNKVS